ncbi:MAG: hypothetical protein CMP64_02885 [Flavobacteriales bacterium]|nr:hypothetical protein [Flavobacteriales bacterium]
MKRVGLLLFIAFLLFFLGQLLWTIGLIVDYPLFGSTFIEEWMLNFLFTSCSVFGMIAGWKLYLNK